MVLYGKWSFIVIIWGATVIINVISAVTMSFLLIGRAKRAPHWGVQSRFRVIYMSVGWYVCRVQKCVGGITWPKSAHAQIWAVKTALWHPCYSFRLYARAVLAWTKKKRSFKNGKLKAKRASETEEQRKERLRIGREKDRTRRITKNYKRKRNGCQKQKSKRNSDWPLSKDWREVCWREN